MATTQVEINYNELKRVVMAVFSYGMQLRAPNLTFSHGNTGNEFLELAARIDKFVSDLEPRHLLLLVTTERLEETVKSAREVAESEQLGKILAKHPSRERRDSKRFSDIERAVDKVNAEPGRDRTSRKRVADRRRS